MNWMPKCKYFLIVFLIRRIAFIVVSFQQVLDASIQLILLSYINLTFMVVYGYYMYHKFYFRRRFELLNEFFLIGSAVIWMVMKDMSVHPVQKEQLSQFHSKSTLVLVCLHIVYLAY